MCTQTLRGQGGNFAYIDEIAYIKPALFYMIIVPLLEVKDTVLVAISTLVDQWNFFSVLMELKDPKGENVFNVYRQQLVCNRCMNRKNPERCTHNDHMIPPWKSKRQVETARLIFGDDTGALRSESLGLVGSNNGSVFSAASIKNFKSASMYDYTVAKDTPPKFVFVACDPNANGPDHTALVALVHINGRIVVRSVVCGICSGAWCGGRRCAAKKHTGGVYTTLNNRGGCNTTTRCMRGAAATANAIAGARCNPRHLRSKDASDKWVVLDKVTHNRERRGGHGVLVRRHGSGYERRKWSTEHLGRWLGEPHNAAIGVRQRRNAWIGRLALCCAHPQLSNAPESQWLAWTVHLSPITRE